MVNRIAGLGSGMDIDGMVAKLMTAERAPLNSLTQKQQSLTWKTQAYRDVNTKISTFRDTLDSIRFSSNLTKSTVTSSDKTKVDASVAGNPAATTHNVVVSQLAQAGRLYSWNSISNQDLSSVNLSGATVTSAAPNPNNQFKIDLNGTVKVITIPNNTYNLTDLGTAIQTSIDTTFGTNQIKVDTSSGNINLTPLGPAGYKPQLTVQAVEGNNGITNFGFNDNQTYKFDPNDILNNQLNKLNNSIGSPIAETSASFLINGKTISYDPSNDSLNAIISKVNNSGAGVTMSYDSITDRISIITKTTGENAKIDVKDNPSSNLKFVNLFNLDPTLDPTVWSPTDPNRPNVVGKNAIVSIDGVPSQYSSNTVTSNGVTYNLHNLTDSNGIVVDVSRDNDALFTQISDYVNKYNDLVDTLNTKINEPKFRTYKPLTDDQRKAMSETEITTWEAKAKSGLLNGDNNLTKIRDSLRQISYVSVSNLPTDTNALYKIGITTLPYTKGDNINSGKLQINSADLKAAIAKDPEGITNLFTNQSPTDTQNEKGIMQQMFELTDNMISKIRNTAGRTTISYDDVSFDLGKQIHDVSLKIQDTQTKLDTKENYYYLLFSKMDSAVANGNAQMSWLQSQLPK